MSVFHALHCLVWRLALILGKVLSLKQKKVRHMVHRSYYHHGKDDYKMARESMHVGMYSTRQFLATSTGSNRPDHCIEYLREGLLCKPDLSLVTYHWINETSQHRDQASLRLPTSSDGCLHECADWQALNTWAGKRAFNLFEYDLLRKPEHGLKYGES